MSGIGALLGLAGISALGNLGSSAIQYFGNKNLQEDAQSFNAQEAQLAREFTAHEAATTRAFNAEQAQLARDFESTKYQRTVADMKAAGINPASVGMAPPSGGSPMANSGMAAGSAASGSPALGISNPMIGNILTTALNAGLARSLQDEHFTKALVENTAYHAHQIESKLNQTDAYRERSEKWRSKKEYKLGSSGYVPHPDLTERENQILSDFYSKMK